MANRLSHFLNWTEAEGLSLDEMSYDDVITYQDGMAPLRPSSRQPGLASATRNQRADEATFYLMWRADKGFRPAFPVPTRLTRIPTPGKNAGKLVYTRTRRLTVSYQQLPTLALPTESQKFVWYSAVRARLGLAKMLASRNIPETGLRAFENAALQVQQWPSRADILAAQRAGRRDAPLRVIFGKGNKERVAGIPISFALMVRDWIDGPRRNLVRPKLRDTGPLFVSDAAGHEGIPLSEATIYRCFKIQAPGGPLVWYPHLGRHDYACNYILKNLRNEAAILKRTLAEMRPDWVVNQTSFWINMLRKKLGHVSETTTERYLQWITESYQCVEVADGWANFLDGNDQ